MIRLGLAMLSKNQGGAKMKKEEYANRIRQTEAFVANVCFILLLMFLIAGATSIVF